MTQQLLKLPTRSGFHSSLQMSDHREPKSIKDGESAQCFFRISIGGEILEKDIVIQLDTQNRPKTCESFLSLCTDSGDIRRDENAKSLGSIGDGDSSIRTCRRSPRPTYRGCEFHRVVPGLCVQAGDWERFDGTGGFSPLYGRNWDDEAGSTTKTGPGKDNTNKHDREGIVSMANAGKPNTNGSQFFVTLKPTPHLDGKHTVFGRVVSGMESVRKMADVERGEKDRPVSLQRIVIEDCGRFTKKPGGNKEELTSDRHIRSRSKKRRRKEVSKRSKRKKHDRKRRSRRNYRDASSGSDSDASVDTADGNDDYSDSVRGKRGRRERHSKKHKKRKRRRNRYENSDTSDSDESSDSSTNDETSSGDKKPRRRRSSGREKDRNKRKKRRMEETRKSSHRR